MRQMLRSLNVLLFTLYLAACSGGNELGNTATETDDDSDQTTTTQSIVLSMVDSVDGSEISNVDGSKSELLNVLYTENELPVEGKVVTFGLNEAIGQLLVTSALTNEEGIASISIFAGDQQGAGTVTATVDDIIDTLDFSVTNPVEVLTDVNLTLELNNSAGENIVNVSSLTPELLVATLTNTGLPSVGVKVTFALEDTVGELITASALTDENGIASILLFAGDQDGAGTVTATVNNISASFDFSASVAAVDVEMGDVVLSPTSIGPNGTASITVPINELVNGVSSPLTESVSVQFSSACVQAGTAEISEAVDTVNGVATATYKDKGCGAVDTINIVSSIGQTILQDSVELTVGAADLQSIQFTEVSSNFIALKGTGGLNRSETATVTFTVLDTLNNPVANKQVNFELTTDVGGIEIIPADFAETDANGQVDVIVSAGNVAVPVKVVATLDEDNSISTISSALSISTGVADFNSFGLSASSLVGNTYNTDGVEINVTARLADHFNNPVPDGTTVQFSSEFGAIDANCLTENGACTVIWRSQGSRIPSPAYTDPDAVISRIGITPCLDSSGNVTGLSAANLPCYYDNRVTGNQNGGLGGVYGNRISIFAHVLGEESFSDSNGSGSYTANENFTDLTEAFRDENEDGVFGARLLDGSVAAGAASSTDSTCYDSSNSCFEPGGDNEEFIDLNGDNTFNKNDGIYNGVLCIDDTQNCSKELVTISRNLTILQSNSDRDDIKHGALVVTNSFETDKLDPNNYDVISIDISASGSVTVQVIASDRFNGSLPEGTTITFDTSNGSITGSSQCTVGLNSEFGINTCRVTVESDDESSSGSLSYVIETPDENRVSDSILIID